MKFEIELENPKWPNFLKARSRYGKREDNLKLYAPVIDVGELSNQQMTQLWDSFREHCEQRKEAMKREASRA